MLDIYDIAEVSPGKFQAGHWDNTSFLHWLFRYPKVFTPVPGCPMFDTCYQAEQWVEVYEVNRRNARDATRTYPRDVGFGFVAADGKFHRLRDDDGY